MRNKLLLCLVLVCLVTNYSECKGGLSGFRSSFGSRSSSRWGGGLFSGSRSKPSSSFSSSHSYPSSSSGLSGSGSSSYNYPKYPSFSYPSSTGLSGSGSSSNKYPSFSYPSSTGLSGSGSSSNKYPSFSYPSSTGLSGSGSSSNKYPSFSYPSSTGLSGSGSSSNKYPSFSYPSSTGLSGSGSSSNKYPSFSYPSSTGLSGSGRTPGYGYRDRNTYPPRYYSAPQHVYITEYRDSGSRYSDLLTGLALYNIGRSHNNIHDRYYYDEYYRRRYHSSGDSYSPNNKPKDDARCILRIKQNGKIEELNIPCEIVSTFTDDSQKLSQDTVTQTVCVTNYTVINNTLPLTTTIAPVNVSVPDNLTSTTLTSKLPKDNTSFAENASTSTSAMSVTLTNSTDQFSSTVQLNTSISNNIFNTTVAPLENNNFMNSSLLLDKEITLNSSATIFFNSSSTPISNISAITSVEGNKTNIELFTTTPTTVISSQITTISHTTKFNSTVTSPIEFNYFTNSSLLLDQEIALNSSATFLNSESTPISNISAVASVEGNKTNIELLTPTPKPIITSQITTTSNTTIFNTTVTPLKKPNDFTDMSLLQDQVIALNSNATIFLNSSSTPISNISAVASVEVNKTNIELLTPTPKPIITSQITTTSNTTIFNTTVTPLKKPNDFTDMSLLQDQVIALNSNATIFLNSSSTPISNISAIPSVEVNKTNIELLTPTTKTIITSQITTMNATNCTVTNDPLSVKGPPIKTSDMECEIDIVTRENHFRNKVNCKTLMEYARMPEPKKESSSSILPSRSKLKSWISNPPWWLSMFIAF